MLSLKRELEAKGIKVIHIKTDSIKIQSPSEETKNFIYEYGEKFGYTFEVEHIFRKFCLVNNAVYIAQYDKPEIADDGHEIWWDATGKEFQRPYVYKTLFSKEPLTFWDFCETRKVDKGNIYLDFNEYDETVHILKSGKEKVVRELQEDPAKRVFVGRIGSFIPVIKGGGLLKAVRETSIADVNDTKGYRWLESEDIPQDSYQDILDRSYFDNLVLKAKAHIEEFGSFDEFIA